MTQSVSIHARILIRKGVRIIRKDIKTYMKKLMIGVSSSSAPIPSWASCMSCEGKRLLIRFCTQSEKSKQARAHQQKVIKSISSKLLQYGTSWLAKGKAKKEAKTQNTHAKKTIYGIKLIIILLALFDSLIFDRIKNLFYKNRNFQMKKNVYLKHGCAKNDFAAALENFPAACYICGNNSPVNSHNISGRAQRLMAAGQVELGIGSRSSYWQSSCKEIINRGNADICYGEAA